MGWMRDDSESVHQGWIYQPSGVWKGRMEPDSAPTYSVIDFILFCILLFPKEIPFTQRTVKNTLPEPKVQDTPPHLYNALVAENCNKSSSKLSPTSLGNIKQISIAVLLLKVT